jgi:hypothetical protein
MLRKTVIPCFVGILLIAGSPAFGSVQPTAAPTTKNVVSQKPLGPAEVLSGTIALLDTQQKLLAIRTSAGVTYSFSITPSTRIMSGSQRIDLAQLAASEHKPATVKFVPTRNGNVAKSIDIGQ